MYTPSVLTLLSFSLLAAARPKLSLNAASLFKRDASCPRNLPQSCVAGSSPVGVDSCCTNTPGGQFLQTQFWDYAPATGPNNSWTVHGLWPDHCDGTYDASCDAARAYTNIREILVAGGAQSTVDFMDIYWKDYQGQDEQFWSHEWSKHGTCISTLDPNCYGVEYVEMEEVVEYFERAVSLFKQLPTYEWLTSAGIVPSSTATYTLAQLQAVANANFGYDAIWNCVSGALNEVWWGYTTQGTIESGTFVAAGPDGSKSTCPDTGIKWISKTAAPVAAPTGMPTGKVFINVVIQDTATPTPTAKAKRAPFFLSVTKRINKRGTPTSPDLSIAERQFNPRKAPSKRAACSGPLPSGVCQQTCPANEVAQTDGTCLCSSPYILSGIACVLESDNTGGTVEGCLISTGKWYTTGTCAGYTITSVDATTFTMTTSKGPCQISTTRSFTCASGLIPTVFAVDDDSNLVVAGSSDFYAATIAAGAVQVVVSTIEDVHHLKLRYGPSA